MLLARAVFFATCASLPLSVLADTAATVRDLQSQGPVVLTKDEVKQLMRGAKLSRVSARGNDHSWSHDDDGTMVVHSDNRMTAGTRSQVASKWHISDDGRYCVLIPWKQIPAEEWCRYVIKTSEGYYMAKSVDTGAEKVFKFDIRK
jgi:hypothetical protein